MTAHTVQHQPQSEHQQQRRRRSSCSHESILSDLFSEAASILSGRFLSSSGCGDDSIVGSLIDVDVHYYDEQSDEEVAHDQQDTISKSDNHGMSGVHSVSKPTESQQSQSATAIYTDSPAWSQPSRQGPTTSSSDIICQNTRQIADIADSNADRTDSFDGASNTNMAATIPIPDATRPTNTSAPSTTTSTSYSPLPSSQEARHFVGQEYIIPLSSLPSDTSTSSSYPSLPQASGTTTYTAFEKRRRRSEQSESHLAIASNFSRPLDDDDSDNDEDSVDLHACGHQRDAKHDSSIPVEEEEEETFEDKRRRRDLNEYHVACADCFLFGDGSQDDDDDDDDSDSEDGD